MTDQTNGVLADGREKGANTTSPSSQLSDVPSEKSQDEEQVAQQPEAKLEDVPPNGGYGWVCTGCCFLINAHTWGLNSSYGVFLAHYLDSNMFPGATRLQFAFVGGLSISCALLVAPLATFVTRRFGTRVTLFIGIFFETLSLIGASFAYEIWQLFLSQGVCFGWGMGFLFVASVGVIPQWFTTRRSLANGIGASGSGLGGLVYSLAAGAIIQQISLAWAFRILGIVSCAVNTTCALLLRDRNKQVGSSQKMFDYHLFRRMEFWLVQAFGFLSMLGYVVLIFSLPNFAASVGLTPHQGSVISAIFNLGQALGRPPIGYFSDTFGRINMAMTMTFLSGLFCLVIWVFAKSYGVLILYAIIGGTVAGTYWAVIAPVTAEVVGLKDVPSALSITWLVLVLPTTFSEPIALQITSGSSGYLGAQLYSGFMYLGAATCLWLLRAWKIGQLQSAAAAVGKDPRKIDPADAHKAVEAIQHAPDAKTAKTSFVVRMITWRKV